MDPYYPMEVYDIPEPTKSDAVHRHYMGLYWGKALGVIWDEFESFNHGMNPARPYVLTLDRAKDLFGVSRGEARSILQLGDTSGPGAWNIWRVPRCLCRIPDGRNFRMELLAFPKDEDSYYLIQTDQGFWPRVDEVEGGVKVGVLPDGLGWQDLQGLRSFLGDYALDWERIPGPSHATGSWGGPYPGLSGPFNDWKEGDYPFRLPEITHSVVVLRSAKRTCLILSGSRHNRFEIHRQYSYALDMVGEDLELWVGR